MMSNISFQALSMIYLLMISFLFFSKKKMTNMDTVIYSFLVIENIILIAIDILSVYALFEDPGNTLLVNLTTKGYLVLCVIWIELLTDYVWQVGFKMGSTMFNVALVVILNILGAIILFSCPLEYLVEDNVMFIEDGTAIYVSYGIFGACIISWLICIVIMARKFSLDEIKQKNKRLYPIFSFVLVGTVALLIQRLYPQFVFSSTIITLVTILMYHTIENPDIDTMREMDEAKQAAIDANKAKSDFLSSMSHEIRTPLNAIIGFSNFISECDDLEEAKSNAKDVVSASEILLETVNGILDISKVESGKLELVNGNYNLKDLLDGTVKMTKARMGDKDLEFITEFQKDLPDSLYGDKSSVNKIIINLLTNAVKYTKEGSITYSVSGTVNNNTCKLMISVKDTGIGIKKEDLEKLFTRFQRFDEQKNSSIEGTGLGMAITKQLVEMMGGSISVSSEYGKGSTFTVTIDQKISDVAVQSNIVNEENESTYDFSDKKVLVVDDNNLNLKLAARLFNKYNCKIETAKSGFECIDLIQNGNKYDIIFLDDVMPNMLGSETLTRIKRLEGFSTPCVSLTANALDGVREKYINLGFDDYLAKPIEKRKLEEILVRFLVNNEQAKDLSAELLKSSSPMALVNSDVTSKILNSPSAKMDEKKAESGDNMNNDIFGTQPVEPVVETPVETPVTTQESAPVENVPVETQPVVETAQPAQNDVVDDNGNYTNYSDKRVLIVDDNKLNLKVAAKFMSRYQFQVDEAYSGEECIEKIKNKEIYDIIFMDIMMPTLSGVETLHELQKIEGFDIPVVVALTADAVEGAKERYLGEGFAEYISKPIVREHLDQVIHGILDK